MSAVLMSTAATTGGTFLVLELVIGGGVGYLIGRYKERPLLGFILGFLIGIFGWIITAIIPRPRRYY